MDDYLGKYYTKHFPIKIICLDKTFFNFNKDLDFLLIFVDSVVSAHKIWKFCELLCCLVTTIDSFS